MADRVRVRTLSTDDLSAAEVAALRALMVDAFGSDDEAFSDEDWEHAVGGLHVVLELDGDIVAHASVVERPLQIGGRPLRTGYVEAVATASPHQGKGFGSRVMAEVNAYIRARFDLGGLGTGRQRFYERQGWRVWAGPSAVRTTDGVRPTPEEDGSIMVLLTPMSPPLDPSAVISCDWRPGDVW